MAIEIIGTGRAIPSKKVKNEELATQIDTSDEWIRTHTGIGNRHIAGEETACSDLALEAAKNALAMTAGFTGDFDTDSAQRDLAAAEAAKGIDLIILATATADYFGCPSTASVVQGKLGAGRAAAMDITAGCSGFVYGLEIAAGFLNIRDDRSRALVIGSEVLSKMTDWNERGTCVLFGDGAGAVVIEKTGAPMDGNDKRGLVRTLMYTDGSGWENLIMRRGGSRHPFKKGEIIDGPIHLEMKGKEVYNFAVKAVTETIDAMVKAIGIKISDITRFVPHQANARIVQAAAKRLGIPIEKFFLNIEKYANTSAASIPIALDEMNRGGQLKRGDMIMTVGFGAGLTYGANLIVW